MQDVRRAYKQVRRQDPVATHIMAAFKMGGNGQSDFCDDGEHGGGFSIRKTIDEENKSGIAVFVVRHYGGVHLGTRRFEHIVNSAKSAINNLYK